MASINFPNSPSAVGLNTSYNSGNGELVVTVAGNFVVPGNVSAYSDRRLKENIHTIDHAAERVLNLRGVYFNRKGDETERRYIGVIAQEVQKTLPEVVFDNDGILSVDYGNIVGLLIEAVKELKLEVDYMRNEVLKYHRRYADM